MIHAQYKCNIIIIIIFGDSDDDEFEGLGAKNVKALLFVLLICSWYALDMLMICSWYAHDMLLIFLSSAIW